MNMAGSTCRDVVLTVVHRANYDYIAPFAVSLTDSGYKGQIVLFTSQMDAESIEKLRKHGVNIVPFFFPGKRDRQKIARVWPIWRGLFSAPLPTGVKRRLAHCAFHLRYRRYLLYLEFLEKREADFDRVFIADSRDVYFQADPFGWNWTEGVHFFLEEPANRIGICPQHRKWLTRQFGEAYFKQHTEKVPTCSGTTYGDVTSIRQYLDAMFTAIMGAHDLSRMPDGDQGIHNYVLFEKLVKNRTVHKNRHGPVLSMAHMMDSGWQTGADGTVLNDNGELVPVLHQYDRFPALKARLLNSL